MIQQQEIIVQSTPSICIPYTHFIDCSAWPHLALTLSVNTQSKICQFETFGVGIHILTYIRVGLRVRVDLGAGVFCGLGNYKIDILIVFGVFYAAQFTFKSHLTHLPTMYTSALSYLPHICEDFWLLEKKSMFIFQLFIRNCTWRFQVFTVGVGC